MILDMIFTIHLICSRFLKKFFFSIFEPLDTLSMIWLESWEAMNHFKMCTNFFLWHLRHMKLHPAGLSKTSSIFFFSHFSPNFLYFSLHLEFYNEIKAWKSLKILGSTHFDLFVSPPLNKCGEYCRKCISGLKESG